MSAEQMVPPIQASGWWEEGQSSVAWLGKDGKGYCNQHNLPLILPSSLDGSDTLILMFNCSAWR